MKKLVLSVLTTAVLLWAPQAASATVITLDLITTFSGATPTGTLTATLDDFGGTGVVQLTLDASNLAPGEFVTEWDFNVDIADATDLTAAWVSGAKSDGPMLGTDAFKANGVGGWYDIYFNFQSGPPSTRLGSSWTTTSVYTFTLEGLTADMFDVLSVIKNPASDSELFVSAAHIQGLAGGLSGWNGGGPTDSGEEPELPGVPEPASFLLIGFGGLLLVSGRFLRRKG